MYKPAAPEMLNKLLMREQQELPHKRYSLLPFFSSPVQLESASFCKILRICASLFSIDEKHCSVLSLVITASFVALLI